MNQATGAIAAYHDLEERFRRLSHIGGAMAILHWDSATMMPPGGAGARAEQLATLTAIHHEQLTDAALAALLDEAEAADLGPWQAANLGEMRRTWRRAAAVTADLAAAYSRATSASEMAWREARGANDFARVAPLLDEVLRLTREIAAARAEVLGRAPYDALLDGYDPDLRAAEIDAVFSDLETFLPVFIERAEAHQSAGPPPVPLAGPFPADIQRTLTERLMDAVGFELEYGRLDVSHHPFTGGVPDDVRITTRYREDDFTESLMAVVHEAGHALYERGLPRDWRDQPVGQSRGMTVHESQSLLMEMHACRSAEFIGFLAPLVRTAFAGEGAGWDVDNLRRLYVRIEPGLIRVEADEATYPLHVILRYRLERALLADDLTVADLPGAWRAGMAASLGVEPVDDKDGCMQDIHWYAGEFGYFPTYTLGALAAAQLFAAAKEAVPEIMPAIAEGRFAPLLTWLRQHIHSYGSLHSTRALITQATGAPLGPEAYKRHLAERYLA